MDKNILLSVRAILFDKSKNNILLLQRSANERHDSLKWEFVGGKANNNEESFKEIITRENFEETGIKNFQFLTNFPFISTFCVKQGVYQGSRFIQILYPCQIQFNEKVIISSEHSDFKWIQHTEINIAELSTPLQNCSDLLLTYIAKYNEKI